ncbi:restriction endonuclease [Mediterraneibacter gnavus]|uniref:restriction endonuclease n=1 Tax=Mediterraneibacter gnavus TaxID=33038 RepID=UPI00366D05FD
MAKAKKILAPTYTELIVPTYKALLELGGSGTNSEICEQVIKDLQLPDEVVDETHMGKINQTELEYQLAWARTYLKNYGVIVNSARSVWSITSDYTVEIELNPTKIVAYTVNKNAKKRMEKSEEKHAADEKPENNNPADDEMEFPDEIKPWREKLAEVLQNMDPYGFERLTQRLLRECGFTQVEVTKKSGDGGIDGTGKLKINGIFSFNVAFQCKRYKGAVGAGDIRDFRGSLTTDIEKGVFITTGTFTKAAKEEASNLGKQQIDLIDGEEFINKIAEYGIGVKEVKTYVIDEEFFEKI